MKTIKELNKELKKKSIILPAPTKVYFRTKDNKKIEIEATRSDYYIKLSDAKRILKSKIEGEKSQEKENDKPK